MNKSFQLAIRLIAATLALAAGAAQAAKVPKADICHLNKEAGVFELISVGENALEPHLAHGDLLAGVDNGDDQLSLDEYCMLAVPPTVLARAYIDVFDDGSAYNAKHDIDIAVLTDLNNDGVPSAGDQLEFDAFPLNDDPCPNGRNCDVGTFDQDRVQTVTEVEDYSSEFVRVLTSPIRFPTNTRFRITFGHNSAFERFGVDSAGSPQSPSLSPMSWITDRFVPAGSQTQCWSEFYVGPHGYLSPNPTVPYLQVFGPCADDPFLDVEIY